MLVSRIVANLTVLQDPVAVGAYKILHTDIVVGAGKFTFTQAE